MTILSIRSRNTTKLSPGEDITTIDSGVEIIEQDCLSCSVPAGHFLTKDHIKLISLSICRPELVLVFVLSLSIFFGLLAFRILDDNKLTSWYWIFANASLTTISFYIVSGLIICLLFIHKTLSRKIVLSCLVLFSILLSIVHWSNPEVILDAGRYFTQAKYLELYGVGYFFGQWGKEIMAWTDLPLVPFIYGIIFKIFGESRVAIQFMNTLFFAGTVCLTYLLGKQLWNDRIGLYGAAMLLAIPYLQTQVSLMMVDVPAMFFLTLAVFLFYRAVIKGGKINIALAVVAIMLAMLAKYSNWVMLSVLPVIGFVLYKRTGEKKDKQKIIRHLMNIMGGFTLFSLITVIWGNEIIYRQIDLLLNYQLPILKGWKESHLSTFIYQTHPFVAISALASLYIAYVKRDFNFLIIGWMLFLVFILGIERIRYVLIVFPMLALLSGYAISHLRKPVLRRYLVMSIIVTASTVSMMGHAAFLGQTSAINLQKSANYIEKLDYSRVEIIALEQERSSVNPALVVPLFDLYSTKEIIRSEVSEIRQRKLTVDQMKSTFRFTWEYKFPEYYHKLNTREGNIVVLILGHQSQSIPDNIKERLSGYEKEIRFSQDEGIFRYKTIVDVYLPVTGGE